MLNEKFTINKEEQKVYPPIKEDVYQVELLDVSSEMKNKYQSTEMERVMAFQFTILKGKDGEEDLRGRNIWRNFVPTYLYIGKNGKNVLYQILEALVGHELSPEEEAKLDSDFLSNLVGKQCRVVIKNKKTDKATYSNIDSLLVATEQLTPLTDEEKENCRVKPKEDISEKAEYPQPAEDTINLEKEEKEINIEDIPF